MSEIIHAWVYDPTRSLFGDKKGRAKLFVLSCEDTGKCDLYKKGNTCLHSGAMGHCPFGKKTCQTGYTQRARGFYSWISDKKKEYSDYLGKLGPLTAYNRIFHAHGHYYFPYSCMTPGLQSGAPLQDKWVQEENVTAELLERVCTARPRSAFGNEILSYQEEEVPKLISDLNAYYPNLFALLSDDQKARLASLNYVGRKADINTCAPGTYSFGTTRWKWDGKTLTCNHIHFPPCKGDILVTVTPKPGSSVEITDNAQVLPTTQFLD
jgi:hypothetical protein